LRWRSGRALDYDRGRCGAGDRDSRRKSTCKKGACKNVDLTRESGGRVVYYAAMSLDGYIAEADDTLDWLTGFEAVPPGEGVETVEGGYEEFYEEVGALVFGSATYEWLLGHMERGGSWPYAGMPCWILSSRELPQPDGGQVAIVNAPVTELFDEMIAAAGDRKLWVVGGGNVASQFADAGLIDDVWVTVVPVVLGSGKPLFDRRLPGPPMRLTAALPRPSGMIELRFEVRRP
jgi:dihydrofolate reductase